MKKNIFIVLGILIFVIANLIYWWQLGGKQNELLEYAVYLISTVLSVVAGIFLVRIYGMRSQHGKAFLFFTFGLLFWFIGEALWAYYGLVLKVDRYPSLADFFFLTAYPLIIWGLIKEIRIAEIKFASINKRILAICGTLSLIFISIVAYLEIFLVFDPRETMINNLIMSYGFADLILVIPSFLILILAWEYKGGKIFVPWIFIFSGLMLYLFADVLYAVFQDKFFENMYPYESIDLLWIAAYLLIALGFLQIGYLIRRIQKKLQPPK
jgi:hypothetical protein